MKKINEQTKSFLLYGIEDVIKPKEIYKLDGAILFLVFLFFFLSESAPSPFFSKVFLVIVYLGFVILSFSRTEVTGKKVFWIIGIQSLTFSILFCWAATILMLTTMKEEYYKRYLTILVIIYILVIAAYIFLIITLIKKDIYNPSSSKKLAGGWLRELRVKVELNQGVRELWLEDGVLLVLYCLEWVSQKYLVAALNIQP